MLRAGLDFGLAAVNVVLGYVSAEAVVVIALIELAGLALCLRSQARFLHVDRPQGAPQAV